MGVENEENKVKDIEHVMEDQGDVIDGERG